MRPILFAVALATASQVAHADKPLGKQRFAEGKAKYASGDYRGAAELFEAAYQADPDPAYLFNVGQAYRRSADAKSADAPRDCQKAMAAYKKFLAQMPDAPNKAEVDGYLAETTACAGPLEVSQPAPEKPTPITVPIAKPIEKPAGATRLQWAGIGTAAVGAVALGIGVYYTKVSHDSSSTHDRLVDQVNAGGLDDQAERDARTEIARLERIGPDQNTRAIAGWLIGGAMVIGGGALYLVGDAKPKERTLVVAPSKTGAMVLGAFRF